MSHWKPYRTLYRQGYHYFDLLKEAREFVQSFGHPPGKPFMIEKLNKGKMSNPRYSYAEIYDDFEVWMLKVGGWKSQKVK